MFGTGGVGIEIPRHAVALVHVHCERGLRGAEGTGALPHAIALVNVHCAWFQEVQRVLFHCHTQSLSQTYIVPGFKEVQRVLFHCSCLVSRGPKGTVPLPHAIALVTRLKGHTA